MPEPASTTNITVEADNASSGSAQGNGSAWPVSGSHLGSLPIHLVSIKRACQLLALQKVAAAGQLFLQLF